MEEKMRILKMVEEGKISAEQAVGLLDALGQAVPAEVPAEAPAGGWVEPVSAQEEATMIKCCGWWWTPRRGTR